MADQNGKRALGGKSAEEVAYDLMRVVAESEGKMGNSTYFISGTERKYILDTFAECLEAAKGNRSLM